MSPPELELLYRAHSRALFAFLLNITRSEADTQDAMQEVFRRLATRDRLPAGLRDERGFLLRLAHDAAVDLIRCHAAGRRVSEAWEDGRAELFAPTADPDADIFHRELAAALGELPPDQRTVVHLKLWERRTFDEIAQWLGIPPNTAASRYRYGLDKLRDRLRPLYEEIRQTTP